MKRIFAVLLALCMAFSCVTVAFAAQNENTVRQYGKEGGYIAFGDSVARGVGATGDNNELTHDFYDRTVEGSYPYLVAQAVGCTINDDAKATDSNFWPVCFHGQTLALTMDLLGIDDGYYDDVYAHSTKQHSFEYYGIMEELYGNAAQYLSQASLITLGFGISDIFYRPIVVAQIEHTEVNGAFIQTIIDNMLQGYDYVKKAYPILLSYIKEHNPDATVVILGNYNVAGDTPLSDDIMLPVGIALNSVLSCFNQMQINLAKEYGYLYCDITNAETLASQKDIGLLSGFMDDAFLAGHLSPEGNAMVARNILKLLPLENGLQKEQTKDIIVDLGRFTEVSMVKLDGVILSEDSYSVNDYELTIPNNRISAASLIVTAQNEEGETSRYIYQLVYRNGGYQAYLIYGIDNATQLIIIKIEEFIRKILHFFKG